MTDRMLISFNHSVAIMLDGRVILISAAICEDLGSISTEITPKENAKSKEDDESNPIDKAKMLTLDLPMFLRVISLGDGKVLNQPVDLMVKWNNISAICELK